MFCRHVFGNISCGFRSISRKCLNFAGPQPREISEALLGWIPCSPFFWNFEIYQSIISPLVIITSGNRPEGLPFRLDEWPSSPPPPPKCPEIHFGHWSLARVAQWWEHSPPTNVAWVSIPGVNAICGLSLLLVPSLALKGFSPGTPVFPSP